MSGQPQRSVSRSPRFVIVNSEDLIRVANSIRWNKRGPEEIKDSGVRANRAQLETAAEILQQAEPSVVTHMGRRRVDLKSERPGFIDPDSQRDPNVLVFQVGILPCNEYLLDRRGDIIERRAA